MLDAVKRGKNIFLTGAGGTGKSHTIRAITEWAAAAGIRCAVTAMTGCAAILLNHEGSAHKAKTLHSWAGVGLARESPSELAGIIELARAVRLAGLSVIVLTGYTSTQVRALVKEQDLKECFDVVVAGPYRSAMHVAVSLRGSRNKEYLFFSDVYSEQDFETVPEAEVLIEADGTVIVTGINVPTMR